MKLFDYCKKYNNIMSILFLLLLSSGCCFVPGPENITYSPNTEPQGAFIREKGKKYTASLWRHEVTNAEKKAKKIEFPKFVFTKAGYKDYVFKAGPLLMDSDLWKRGDRSFQNSDKVHLEKTPDYYPDDKKIVLKINSEPQGAKIYEGGEYHGITPRTFTYDINKDHYKRGYIKCKRITVVKEGHLPSHQELKLTVDNDWRYEYQDTYKTATLFLLKRDPLYRPPQALNQNYNVDMNVKQEESELDKLLKASQIGVLLKTLSPTR